MTRLERETRALRWVVDLLRRLDVPFQAVGGLAARAYGVDRPLADLDSCVPTGRLPDIAAAAAFVVRPPAHHRDAVWDLTFAKLDSGDAKAELIDYKRAVDREVDRQDVAAILARDGARMR